MGDNNVVAWGVGANMKDIFVVLLTYYYFYFLSLNFFCSFVFCFSFFVFFLQK